MCCFDVGKLNEAELILTNESPQKPKTVKEFSDEYGDTAPFAISLLADIYRKTERPDKALEYYYASLSLNPFLWSSFSNICKLGGKPDPEKIFQAGHVQQAMNSVKSVLFSPYATSCTSLLAGKLPLIDSPGDNISVLEDSIMSTKLKALLFILQQMAVIVVFLPHHLQWLASCLYRNSTTSKH
ncbi:Cdc27 [Bugula neritina]|uniref:Cdc27 n=1 Tax=Bugula neritina TaxID=10212 RepID=A0A7J7JX71_BUGNE|nr:Cdc27 [Bugula neritina]